MVPTLSPVLSTLQRFFFFVDWTLFDHADGTSSDAHPETRLSGRAALDVAGCCALVVPPLANLCQSLHHVLNMLITNITTTAAAA